MSKPRTLKGWTFAEKVHAGSYTKCRPFFQYEREANATAERFINTGSVITVVRATLTFAPPKQKKPARRKV